VGLIETVPLKCWFHYSGADKVMNENPGLYHILCYREQQDRNLKYTAADHKILEFIDILEKGTCLSTDYHNVNFVF
jgi:hypothetical protein